MSMMDWGLDIVSMVRSTLIALFMHGVVATDPIDFNFQQLHEHPEASTPCLPCCKHEEANASSFCTELWLVACALRHTAQHGDNPSVKQMFVATCFSMYQAVSALSSGGSVDI